MPLSRFAKLPEDKQRRIVDAATAEFAAHGFDEASFNRIIATAGLSKGAMYYYFADKADLYGAVCERAIERVAEVVLPLEPATSAESFWERIGEGLGLLATAFLHDVELGALARDFYARGPSAAAEAVNARVLGWVARLLAHGQQLGAVRDDLPRDLLAEILTAMVFAIDRWSASAMTELPPDDLVALGPKTLDLARKMLEPSPPPRLRKPSPKKRR